MTNNSYPEIQDTTNEMKPGDLIKFAGYYEDWHIDDDVWKYGVLVDRKGTDFYLLYQSGIYNFSAPHWYLKKAE